METIESELSFFPSFFQLLKARFLKSTAIKMLKKVRKKRIVIVYQCIRV